MFRALTIAAITTAVVFSGQFVFSERGEDTAALLNTGLLNKGLLNSVSNAGLTDTRTSYAAENVAELRDGMTMVQDGSAKQAATNFTFTRHVDTNSLSPPAFSLSSVF